MPTMLLDRVDVKNLITMKDAIRVVEGAFRLYSAGKGSMPAKAYLNVECGDFRAMPAALPGCAGMKWVNAHAQNPSHNLPSVMAVIIYNDPETGYPLAIMDGTEITALRTGATAAIASKYLARQDSHSLGIIGAGYQAYAQILAHVELFDLRSIKVFDISKPAADKLIKFLPRYAIRKATIEEATASDILCTLTPSRTQIIKREWVNSGTHINAVGADAEGKEELDPSILHDAVVVVDDIRQASTSGEINVPIKNGLFSVTDVYGTLAELVGGSKQGRTDKKAITVFDSTGVAIEDLAVSQFVFEKAKGIGGYPSLDLVGK